jgi:hypothetical protein
VIAGLNHSGWSDLVVSNTYSGDLSVYYGASGRQFSPEVLLAAGLGAAVVEPQGGGLIPHSTDLPTGVTTGVFDSSGLTDVVSVQSGADRISILEGTTGGELADPSVATSYTTGSDPTQVVAAPLTKDGLTDLVVLNQGSDNISIFLNNGKGGFTTMPLVDAGNDPTGVAVRDANGDGIPDLLVSNSQGDLLIVLGNGNGTFKPYERADQTVSLAVGDFDNSDQPEYVLSNASIDQLSIQYGGTPSFVQGRHQGIEAPGAVDVADLNGDGNSDIIVVNTGDNDILVYLGLGGNRFEAPLFYSTGTDPVGLTVADLTGTGVPDLIVANAGSNDLSIFIGIGQGANWTLETGPRLTVGDEPVSTTVADVDGNGIPDIICVDKGSNNVLVLRGLGGGFFADNHPLTLPTGQGPILAFAGKFDGDGGLDLAVLDSGSNNLTYYSNFASGRSTPTFIPTGGVDPIAAVMGDYTGDGYDDLVIAENGDSLISLFEGGPDGLVLTYSGILGQPVRPTDLVISGAEPGQIHLAISAEGQDQVYSFTLVLAFGTSGAGAAQAGGYSSSQPSSSQTGSAEATSFSIDGRSSFALLLAEPASQEQAIVQATTPSTGSSGYSGSAALILGSVNSTIQSMLNPSLGSLSGVINSLVQLGQLQISDIMPLGNSTIEAVAVLLVVTNTSMDDLSGNGIETVEESEPSDSLALAQVHATSTRGSNLERFLSDLEGSLDDISRAVLGVTQPQIEDGSQVSLPTASSGTIAVPNEDARDPIDSAASLHGGPIAWKSPRHGPGTAFELSSSDTLDSVNTTALSATETAENRAAWMRPLCGFLIGSSVLLGWTAARYRRRSQPVVGKLPSFPAPRTPDRSRA